MKVLIESMTRYKFQGFTVRCWREEESFSMEAQRITFRDINIAINGVGSYDENTIAETLIKLDRMNAVEVLDKRGQGVVLYKNWP